MTAIDHNTANYIRVAPMEGPLQGMQTVASGVAPAADPMCLPSYWSPRALILRLLGGCMVLASTGLWLVDGAGDDPELALIRIGASVMLLFFGLVLMLLNDPAAQPEVEFDTAAGELRILESARRSTKLVSRHSFASLAGVQFTNGALMVYDLQGHVVVAVPLVDAKSRRLIQTQIAGHLAHLA
ncbi:hypothetical protein TRM7557_03500 [Tritonibacter multivorans]|uniref:YcxB-like protein domain-containing protein n=1 Tax=Tritonibacter multivorans TaxID=928856 RepID=A0A0P1GIP2_9RHOB|nr:hypothetical protein [Tritonibacter multivorans]MDA7420445.1 hypothetical protein [Tritonibacter multivorans]CUH81592.1 hypothetical protein TRM7557_03500 [Tritonibacter multivorans]SFC38806.1 hypothetical protein SAMN04488049_102337 [Tritonibacter multivorans]